MRPVPLLFTWVLCSVLVAGFSQIGTADEPKQDALTAKQILDRMAKTYADCKSYRDSQKLFVRLGRNLTGVFGL